MSYGYQTIDISDIPQKTYDGYLWYSDSDRPMVLKADPWPGIRSDAFIVEGHIVAEDGSLSISVRNTGEGYIVGLVDWSEAQASDVELECLERLPAPALKRARVLKLKFKRAWVPESDPQCPDMPVLEPAWTVLTNLECSEA